jgi:hypothetical protein
VQNGLEKGWFRCSDLVEFRSHSGTKRVLIILFGLEFVRLGSGHYFSQCRSGTKEKCFSKKPKYFLPNLKYQLENKYHAPLAKNFTKEYHSVVTHVL